MSSSFKPSSRQTWRLFAILLACLLVQACASGGGGGVQAPSETVDTPVGQRGVLELLELAETQASPAREASQLEAARLLVNLNRQQEALELLQTVDIQPLPLEMAGEILILHAALLVESNQLEAALARLISELPAELPPLPTEQQKQVRLLRAEAFQASNQLLPAAQERIQAATLMGRREAAANHEQVWTLLTALPAEQLDTLAANARTYAFQGWYELARIGKSWEYNLERQLQELEAWQQDWPRHPAAAFLPQAMQMARDMAASRPERLALILPLQSSAGRIVRDGFMTAYFDVLRNGGQLPEIRLYDSSDAEAARPLIDQAVAEGADLIIGPLQKPLVTQLLRERELPVPVLALNAVENGRARSEQLFQFSLSPESEARQIALRAWEDGHRYAAILSPVEAAGEDYYSRKRASFVAAWQALGGEVVEQQLFREDYTEVIERLLNLDESAYRHEHLEELLGRNLDFVPRRRQDIDFILLIAQPGAARQIKPSLGYLYAGDVPVYATQDVYSGLARPLEDRDLNGVLFGDSPWLLGTDPLKGTAQELFPQDSGLSLRLQAFGVDTFRLYPRLGQLDSMPGLRLFGATGVLRMDENHTITQELDWARFRDGQARLVDKSVPATQPQG